jgi:cbb3-type cytochrome oxidase subunit 3
MELLDFNFALSLWTLFLILAMIGFSVFLYKFFNRKSSKR